jgi:maltose O-acetyltransferase
MTTTPHFDGLPEQPNSPSNAVLEATGEDAAMSNANVVDARRGWKDQLLYTLRSALLFGANRIIGPMPGHALRRAYYRHALDWEIGERSSIHHGLKIFGGRGRVKIGKRSTLQMDCLIVGAGMDDLTIGNDVAIAYRSALIMGSHDIWSPEFKGITGPITIEDHAFIGSGSTILLGVTIGEGAVVTAGSVVTKSIPPFTIVRGNPACVVGRRTRNLDYSAEHFWMFH